jgi:putative Holliday junction resolvase
MGRLLGIDYGERRVGLALSDPTQKFARPYRTVDASTRLLETLRSVIRDEEVEGIVLGLPRNMDGSLGRKAEEVLRFKERLEADSGLPVATWDERLTTAEAIRLLDLAGVSPRDRRRTVDRVAAQILLQSYLDAGELREGKEP